MKEGDLVFFTWPNHEMGENRIGIVAEDIGNDLVKLYHDDSQDSKPIGPKKVIIISKQNVQTFKSRIEDNPFKILPSRIGYLVSRLRGKYVKSKSSVQRLERFMAYDSNIVIEKPSGKVVSNTAVHIRHKQIPFRDPLRIFSLFSESAETFELELLKAEKMKKIGVDTNHLLSFTKYDTWKSEEQKKSVDSLLKKSNNLLSIIPTAGGKSLIYQILTKAHVDEGLGITWVVTPTISLIRDQMKQLRQKESGIELKSASLDSLMGEQQIEEEKSRIKAGIVDIIYTTPKMAVHSDILYLIGQLPERNVELFVIDEAHLISDWGLSFYPEYRRIDYIRQHLLAVNQRLKTLLLSATVTKKTKADVTERVFHGEKFEIIDSDKTRDDLTLGVKDFGFYAEKRFRTIIQSLRERLNKGEQGVVYCLRKKATGHRYTSCEEIEQVLANEYPVATYSGDSGGEERNQITEDFDSGKIQLVIATKAFGLGINKPDIRFVYHLGHPKNLDSLYQEFSRGGRDSKGCKAVLFSQKYDYGIHKRDIYSDMLSAPNAKERLELMLMGSGKKFSSDSELSMKDILGDDNFLLLDSLRVPDKHSNSHDISSRRKHISLNVSLLSFLEEFDWIRIVYDASSRFEITDSDGNPAEFPKNLLAESKEDFRNYVEVRVGKDHTTVDISSIYLESQNFVDLEREIIRICKERNYNLEIIGGLKVTVPTRKFPPVSKFMAEYNNERDKLTASKMEELDLVKEYIKNVDQCRMLTFKKIYGYGDYLNPDFDCLCDVCESKRNSGVVS